MTITASSAFTFHGKHNLFPDGVAASGDPDVTALPDSFVLFGNAESLGTLPIGLAVPPKMTPIAQVLYLTEPGQSSAIAATDIHQGGLGDCFLLSSIGELALFHPSAITSMIHTNGNGFETVTLYTASNGRLPSFSTTAFKSVQVIVNNNSFSAIGVNGKDSVSQDIVGQQQEIWPQVLEQADATLNGGYSAIAHGGYPVLAMEELTGQVATAVAPSGLTWSALLSDVSGGDLLVFDTKNAKNLSYGLVGDHAYMFGSVNTTNDTVQLLNPWGFDNPAAIPFSKLAQAGINEIDIGHVTAAPTTSTVRV